MSPTALVQDVLELIIGNLFWERETLKACCVVSKSWVPLARQHLFHTIEFDEHNQGLWAKAFPDPPNSPAHHTRNLTLRGLPTIAATSTQPLAWIRSFCNVLEFKLHWCSVQLFLVPLHGFSPNLKSLSLEGLLAPPQELLDLVCSFPSLKNLELNVSTYHYTLANEWKAPSNSPTLAGTLQLRGKIGYIAGKLSDLPNGLRPVKVTMEGDVESASLMNNLLSKCSDTLESFHIGFRYELGACSSASVVDQTPYRC